MRDAGMDHGQDEATLQTVRSADLSPGELELLRGFLDEAFEGPFGDDDWSHTVGGLHVFVREGHLVLAHAAVVGRTFWADGRRMDTGYVEGVATRPERRGEGHATSAMQEAGRQIRQRYQLGALSDGTGIPGFYERLGWEHWRGPTFVASPVGPRRTADEDEGVMVLRTPSTDDLELASALTCDWRSGDVW
jgi:aminoglycoside 2'-N-acetyltransferase I